MNFQPGGFSVVTPSGNSALIPVNDLTSFHDYRLESSGTCGQVRVYVDGALAFFGDAAPNTNHNVVSFGDGITPGEGADADWDFIRFSQSDPVVPATYCTAKTTSNGCVPAIAWSGKPLASLTGGFHVTATQTNNQVNGLLFYGLSGRAAIPFQNGLLCVLPPLKRGPILNSGGSAPPTQDCSGTFDLDIDAYAQTPSALAQLSIPGSVVQAQWWGRDQGFGAPNNTLLSDAIEFTVRP